MHMMRTMSCTYLETQQCFVVLWTTTATGIEHEHEDGHEQAHGHEHGRIHHVHERHQQHINSMASSQSSSTSGISAMHDIHDTWQAHALLGSDFPHMSWYECAGLVRIDECKRETCILGTSSSCNMDVYVTSRRHSQTTRTSHMHGAVQQHNVYDETSGNACAHVASFAYLSLL